MRKRTALARAASLEKAPVSSPQAVASPESQEVRTDLATVSDVRYWSNEDYTRVVIQLDGEVEFRKEILQDPDRFLLTVSTETENHRKIRIDFS